MSTVLAVSSSPEHVFSKAPQPSIQLLASLGVQGDAHAGVTVQHRSRVAADPTQPNLRQVHLLALSRGALLQLGDLAVVEITGLRNPCVQIQAYRAGLLKQVVSTSTDGTVVRRAGVMAVVVTGGPVAPGDPVRITPPSFHVPLERV
jgi:hypothetical protein